MKNLIKSITLLIALGVSFNSCLLDDDNLADSFDDGPNFTSFSNLNQTVSAVADGELKTANVNIELQGPNMVGFSEDVTLTIGVDAANTTAIEGVHYTLSTNSVTLTKANNYIGTIPVGIITEGIDPPLAVAPIITLEFTDASGTNVIPSSKETKLTIIYQCFADLSGIYLVTNDACSPSKLATITQNADGSWFLESADGYFLDQCTANTGLYNSGNIVELCGEIIPTNDLTYGFLDLGTILSGTWDSENGILTLNHRQTFTGNWPGTWTSTYTRQ
ncbi:DUF4843 domain-containing protein [Aestuariivivens sediminis]|uniref:DUF4843 domain-containing protein n=1 Tax=Aestuariivivens sediminis TaxID=2913557 RepID=UPI001F590EB4|nr:DUF4843 domain-containing protein [Aestuariivivens sediminis]